ncbi:hypothetical protein BX600DRAFT_177443 [Xylariales sp. PMI_506]|nr:hypothetical protein BX600DRAFT_177443 [Xylariales sp. PMI_506]
MNWSVIHQDMCRVACFARHGKWHATCGSSHSALADLLPKAIQATSLLATSSRFPPLEHAKSRCAGSGLCTSSPRNSFPPTPNPCSEKWVRWTRSPQGMPPSIDVSAGAEHPRAIHPDLPHGRHKNKALRATAPQARHRYRTAEGVDPFARCTGKAISLALEAETGFLDG